MKESIKKIAIVGGGPSALFMFKRLADANANIQVVIYERSDYLGAGMPYSEKGACDEHITNVSPNEIPECITPVGEWLERAPAEFIRRYNISATTLNEYKVMPRILFGHYLHSQFDLLLKQAKKQGMEVIVRLNTEVVDILDKPELKQVQVIAGNGDEENFGKVIICTGHNWPETYEGKVPGYFDSPYPPAKLALKINYPVAIRGSSLTAIDAIRTLARNNGFFSEREDGLLDYTIAADSDGFKMSLYSLNGLLPALRFHLEDSHLQKNAVLSDEAIEENKQHNEGFLSLDYIFEKNFKELFKDADPEMYKQIKHLRMEEFVSQMMSLRNELDAFTLFKAEYAEAEKSIKRRQSVHWKEMLAVLSFAMNYPAKHFSAEDMMRLQKVLKPLISIVIAFVPQSSARELIALYNAGVLEIVPVSQDSNVSPGEKEGAVVHYMEGDRKKEVSFQLFVDCIGQPQLLYNQFPFKSLLNKKTLSAAMIKFRSDEAGETVSSSQPDTVVKTSSGDYYLKVPGIAINDNFQVVDSYGAVNPRIYIMAVPYIGGFNPDYSGLDFCEAASLKIVTRLLSLEN